MAGAAMLRDWTRTLRDERAAVHLVDLARGLTTYHMFLPPTRCNGTSR